MRTRVLAWVFFSAAAILLGAVITLWCLHVRAVHRRCTNNGGHWEDVNCHEVTASVCTSVAVGSNMAVTTCQPVTHTACDEVCVGARPEASP